MRNKERDFVSPNACGNAVAAIDFDFRNEVNGNSRSPHC